MRGRLVLLVAAAFLPFVVILLITSLQQRQAVAQAAQERSRALASELASEQGERFSEAQDLLAVLSGLPAIRQGGGPDCSAMLADLLPSYAHVLNLGLIDRNGFLVCSAVPFVAPVSLADRGYFRDALATGKFAAGSFQIGRVTGQPSINFGYPLRDTNGAITHVLFLALSLDPMTGVASQASLPSGSTVTVFDKDGTILIRYPDTTNWAGRDESSSPLMAGIMAAGGDGVTQVADLDGQPMLFAFQPLTSGSITGAYIAVGIPRAAAFAPANLLFQRNMGVLLAGLLLALALAWLGADHQLLGPIRRLGEVASKIESGDLGARTGGNPAWADELDALARAFDQMAKALQQREEEMETALTELQSSESRFRSLAENSLVGVYVVQGGRFQYVNPVLAETFGYQVEDVTGTLGPEDLTVPEDRAIVRENIRSRVEGDTKTVHYRFRGLTRAGKVIECEVLGAAQEFEGKPSVIGTLLDISERSRAETRIRQNLDRLNALRSIDQAITGSLDPRVTFNVLLDQVTIQLQVDAADILYHEPHARTLNFAAGRGFRTEALQHTSLKLGEGYAGRAALEQSVVHIQDLKAEDGEFGRSPKLALEGFVSYFAVPLISKGTVQGVLEVFHRKPLEPDSEWLDFLHALAGQAAIAIDNATLFDELHRLNINLVSAYDTTLEGWSRALELRDRETQGHTLRVTDVTLRLARLVGIAGSELIHLRRGALLHDIGKMGIPDSILHKPGPLDDTEWAIMKQHPVLAYELLSPIEYLRPALDIPYCHHEKWDGSGYPRGLAGESIPLAARVFAIADVWDALRSDRPYRSAWPDGQVMNYLRGERGRHFDPNVLEAFLTLEPDLREVFPRQAMSGAA